jgi:nucleotidyltransferase substrate binding protein (TIGR01987 family)
MNDIRWKQRHANYTNILKILNDSLTDKELEDFTELERIGLAKSFEVSFELLWKLLKDFLEYEEIEIGLISPKNILKAAASSGVLEKIGANGDILMQAHKSRNELAHIYDYEKFSTALESIKKSYLLEMIKIDDFFKKLGDGDE